MRAKIMAKKEVAREGQTDSHRTTTKTGGEAVQRGGTSRSLDTKPATAAAT